MCGPWETPDWVQGREGLPWSSWGIQGMCDGKLFSQAEAVVHFSLWSASHCNAEMSQEVQAIPFSNASIRLCLQTKFGNYWKLSYSVGIMRASKCFWWMTCWLKYRHYIKVLLCDNGIVLRAWLTACNMLTPYMAFIKQADGRPQALNCIPWRISHLSSTQSSYSHAPLLRPNCKSHKDFPPKSYCR